MPRIRSQLAVELRPDLLARLRAEAAARRCTITRLLADWIEADMPGQPAEVTPSVLARIEALEREVADLRGAALSSPDRVIAAPRSGDRSLPDQQAQITRSGDDLPVEGAITTAELAQLTRTNRAAWNNWAAKAQQGDVREHPQAGRWRLAGRAAAAAGGPPRWLWQQA